MEVMLAFVGILWFCCTVYLMRWHIKNGDLTIGTTFTSVLLGPVLSIFVKQDELGRKKDNQLPNYRSIPPPPPIANRPPIPRFYREEKTKEFKFFRG